MQILRGLGFKPPVSVVKATPIVSAAAYGMATAIPEGALTSDGKLVWTYTIEPLGVWQIVAPDEKPDPKMLTSIDSTDILQGNGTWAESSLYVGGFAIDRTSIIKNNRWTISIIDMPAQLSKPTLAWLVQQIQAAKSQKAGYDWPTLLSVDVNGNPITCGYQTSYPAPPASCPKTACIDGFAESLNGGEIWLSDASVSATPVVKWWSGNDEQGFLAHFANYKNDPHTFKFYSYCDWYNAMGGPSWNPCSGADGSSIKGPCLPSTDMNLFFKQLDQYWAPGVLGALGQKGPAWQLQKSEPPIGKFVHPITGKTWGLWASLYPSPNPCHDPTNCGDASQHIGAWNSSIDSPNSVSLQIGLRELPDPGWWNLLWGDVFDAIKWIGSVVAAGLQAIADALTALVQSLACATDAASQAQLAQLIKTNPAAATVLAAARLTCPPPVATPPTRCSNGSIVVAGQTCPAPWYLQWYTLVLAGGAVAVAAVHIARSRR